MQFLDVPENIEQPGRSPHGQDENVRAFLSMLGRELYGEKERFEH
jgi:hypothetical protein